MDLSKINIYRIIHRSNLAYILQHGMHSIGHAAFDPNNIFIGDSTLTEQRRDFPIPLADCGNLGDYVPFYFGYRSPMLFNIATGYRGVVKRPQSDIVYLVCKLDSLVKAACPLIFTDGHAKNQVTRFFTDTTDLNQIDWDSVNALTWKNTEDKPDRMRRKQAECLVKSEVPPQYIAALVVYDAATRTDVETLVKNAGLSIGVYINPKGEFYYANV
jgi:hypothetical protein